MSDYEDRLNFTINSEDEFYNIVDDKDFFDKNAEIIYKYLHDSMEIIPFGDYLKRYIFKLADFTGDYRKIELKEYQEIIKDSFAENATPKSFTETTSQMSVLSKNWLTQTSVKRNVVFLLGFGLGMTVEDVSDFLVHALDERDFNFKNPFEVICWYCYKHGYKYPKFVQLMDAYDELPYGDGYLSADATIGVRDLLMSTDTEEELMQKLAEIKTENNGHFYSVSAKQHFETLYEKVKNIIAEQYTEDAKQQSSNEAAEYLEAKENSVVLTLEEKVHRAELIRDSYKRFIAEDIKDADAEQFLCCGIPFDEKGNLYKISKSTLANHFYNKRMSRQRIHDIFAGRIGADRFDLITMNFFVFAMSDVYSDRKTRFYQFVENTNKMLNKCCLGKLYIANPYECFIQMCILSDYPMGTYSDVLEKSYNTDESEI